VYDGSPGISNRASEAAMGRLSDDFFQSLGGKAREIQCLLASLTGSEAEAIEAEFELGRYLARQFRSAEDAPPWYGDFVGQVSVRLQRSIKEKRWRFRPRAIEESRVNAFALPGGFIFVTRLLVDFCAKDPDEVAWVVGHEMGHVVLCHTRNRLLADALISTAISKLTPGGLAAFALGKVATKFLQQAYAQEDELDADEFGVLLARRTGYDPRAAVRFLERVAAHSRTKSRLARYFASHPSPDARTDAIRRLLE